MKPILPSEALIQHAAVLGKTRSGKSSGAGLSVDIPLNEKVRWRHGMIQAPSSVIALAAEACRVAGVTLDDLRANIRTRGPRWSLIRQRVVYRMKQAELPPSFHEIGAAIGSKHNTCVDAYQREVRRRETAVDEIERYGVPGLLKIGMGVVAGLDDWGPMYNDGEEQAAPLSHRGERC